MKQLTFRYAAEQLHALCVKLSMILHSDFSYFMRMPADVLAKTAKEAAKFGKDVFSTGGTIFVGIVDGILGGFKTVVNGIIGGLNAVIKVPFDDINAALNTIKGVSIVGLKPFDWITPISIPQIPMLASGGVVDQPTILEAGERANIRFLDIQVFPSGVSVATPELPEEASDTNLPEGCRRQGGVFVGQRRDQSAARSRPSPLCKAHRESVRAMATENKRRKMSGKRIDMRQIALDYSKRLTNDMRPLLWVVTIGGLLLGFYAVHERFEGALPWISAMVGLPWTAWGTAAAFYMNLAKSDHSKGGITYETVMAEILGAESDPDDFGTGNTI